MAAHLSDIKSGQYVLIDGPVLAKVTSVRETGFNFHCENGAWNGFYRNDNTLSCEGDKFLPASIISTKQPPEKLYHYNEIIPWMRDNA